MRLFAIPLIVLFLWSDAAFAHRLPCGDIATVTERLRNAYDEKPVSIGAAANGSLIVVYASVDGTFTIIITSPNGPTCMLAYGEEWTAIKDEGEEL